MKLNLGELCKGYEWDMSCEMPFLSGNRRSECGHVGKHIQAITLSSGELFCPLFVILIVFLYSFNFPRCIRLYWVGE